MPWASALSRLGVAKQTMQSYSTLALTAAGVSLTVANPGTATSTAKIIILDGVNTEVVTASVLAGSVFTISALAHNHPVGVLVASVGTTIAATDYIPYTTITPYDEIKWLEDTGIRGSRVALYDQVEGPRMGMFDISGDVFCDTIGWPLFGVLNDQGYTVGPPQIFTGAVLNSGNGQPTPIMYIDNNSTVCRAYAGAVHSEIALAFNADGKITYTAKATGYVSGPITAPTASYSALEVAPAWAITATIGGTANVLVQEGSITIKPSSVDAINTLDGSQDPYGFFANAVEADGKMLFVYEDDTQLYNYLNNSKPSLDFLFSRGAGATLEALQLHMTSCGYTTGKPVRTKSFVELEVEFKALGNTTDAGASGGRSPIKATLKNALTNAGRYQ
jgi:hypothetical protein